MGCGDKCPYVPGLRRDDWPLKDPKGLPLEEVRAIRDEVKRRVQELLLREDAPCLEAYNSSTSARTSSLRLSFMP